MYYVIEKDFPKDNILYEAINENEAIEAVKFFTDNGHKRVYHRKQTREELNHSANIFANNQ
jgi:hypothetical protein